MNFSIAAAVFPVIFVGELPDKTMFASVVLSARGRPRAVWAGAALAFAVHVVIATTVGVLAFRLLPDRVVKAMVAAVFAGGALLAIREARAGGPAPEGDARGPGADGRPDAEAPAAGPAQPPAVQPLGAPVRRRPGWGRTVATAFAVIFAAEWGDLTQILTANLAAQYHRPLAVGAGALLALWSVAALAVIGGRRLASALSPAVLSAGTAALLVGLAGYAAWGALR